MMRMLIKGVTKGTKGNHYLIADVGTADTLKDIGAQQTAQICATRLSHSAHNTRPSTLQKPFDLQGGQCTEQDEARHDGSSMVEMADTEQHTYLPHDTDTGSTLPNLPATMPQWQSQESHYCGRRLLQRWVVFGEGTGQGKRATTCQAGGTVEAVWIQCHLLDLHMWLHWITVS